MDDRAPATGSDRPEDTELAPEEEPRTTGTLFLVMIILMIIVAIWVIMYMRLLDR
jgi:flagellar biogenesis protein FliO